MVLYALIFELKVLVFSFPFPTKGSFLMGNHKLLLKKAKRSKYISTKWFIYTVLICFSSGGTMHGLFLTHIVIWIDNYFTCFRTRIYSHSFFFFLNITFISWSLAFPINRSINWLISLRKCCFISVILHIPVNHSSQISIKITV